MSEPRLGVLITYYNERELLRECLQSLLADDRRPHEILIYDDASTYPAEDYIPSGEDIRVFRGDVNHGPACGRNILLGASRSDYIHFHDADDLFDPRWCTAITDAIQDRTSDAVFTEVSSYRGGKLECERVLGLEKLLKSRDLVQFALRGAILPASGTYRRQNVLAIGGYREDLWQSEDYDFHIRLAASGIRFMVIGHPLVTIRVREASRSQNQVEVWESAVQSIRMLATEIDSKYRPELASRAVLAGSTLYKAGAHQQARTAFQLAEELGPPTYEGQRPLYRAIARTLGPVAAERCSSIYRSLIPNVSRKYLADLGW
jgi:glycosyltransferase involved in cell wall biosynthesis